MFSNKKQIILPIFITFLSLLSISSSAYAEMYQWRDKEGKLHFSDKKPINANAQKKNIKVDNKGISFADDEAVSKYKSRTESERKHELAQRANKKQKHQISKKTSRKTSNKNKMTHNDRSSKKQYSEREIAAGLEAARLLRERRQNNWR